MRKSEEIKLRVTADEKACWQEAAESEGVGVSELIRRRMNHATDSALEETIKHEAFSETALAIRPYVRSVCGVACSPPPDQIPAETQAGLERLFRSPDPVDKIVRNITDVLPADEHPRRTADCACGKPTYVYCSKCDA